jgi:hypothetical protein
MSPPLEKRCPVSDDNSRPVTAERQPPKKEEGKDRGTVDEHGVGVGVMCSNTH